jgi:hypothetical protein
VTAQHVNRVGVVVVIVAAAFTSRGASAATVDREAAVRGLLVERDRAVTSGDRNAFMATIDPGATNAFKEAQGRYFDGVRTVALSSYASQLRVDEVPDISAGLLERYRADAVFLPDVDVRYRLKDVDTVDAIDTYWYTFVLRDGKWRIISDSDVEDVGLQSARNPWDFGAVARRDSAHFSILFNPADSTRAETILKTAEDAYAGLVATVGRPTPARIPVILPHDIGQLKEMIQATFDVSNFVAFASSGVDRDAGYQFTAPRVYIQDTNLGKYDRKFQLQTLHHEFVHVTAFSFAGPFDPSWVHEGTADWLSQGKFAPKAVAGTDGIPPEDYEFTTGGQSSILRAYGESDSAVAYLAKTRGASAPVDLLETIGQHRIDAGTERYWTDQGMRAVYHDSLDAFVKAWNGGR